MKKFQKYAIEIMFFIINILFLALITYLLIEDIIIFEIFMALLFAQVLGSCFILGFYYLHNKFKKLAKDLNFDFITRFMEQPRMEGTYKKNWWQIHFSSRAYGEYWGLPRTYIKLQFKEKKKFNTNLLLKYVGCDHGNCKINNIEHIQRPYKNYLLMRVKYYVTKKEEILKLMDLLLKVAKESEIKK